MKLLDQTRQLLRAGRTEQAYLYWIEQYVRFCKTPQGFRHPAQLGAAEVEQWLTHLAAERHASAGTQNQALGTVLFLSRVVLQQNLGSLDAVRAALPPRPCGTHAGRSASAAGRSADDRAVRADGASDVWGCG
jgi:hypothetical protein